MNRRILGLFALLAFCSFLLQAQAVVDGFSLDQISFAAAHSGNVPCSEYGHATFAVRQAPGQVQYIQVVAQLAGNSSAAAWIVRNVPAVGAIVLASTSVDLTQMAVTRGTCITGSRVTYSISVTDTPASTAPSLTGSQSVVVGQRTDRAEGGLVSGTQPGTLAAPDPPLRTELLRPAQEAGDLNIQIIDREGMGNVPQGQNECGPGAVVNSMHWLQSRGSINLGNETPAQTLTKLKSDMIPSGWRGNGVFGTEMIAGKLRFAQRAEHPLDLEIHYQSDATFPAGYTDLGASVTVGTATAMRDGAAAPPTFEYIRQEMAKGQDVEIDLVWLNAAGATTGGHIIAVSGVGTGPDGEGIWFNDDLVQNGQPGGARNNHWARKTTDGTYMRLGGLSRNRVRAVYSESPRPLLLTFIPLEEFDQDFGAGLGVYRITPFTPGAANPASVRSPVAAGGGLTPVSGSPFPAGTQSVAAATALGRFAYVANLASNNVNGFKIDPITGVLTTITGSPFPTGSMPFSLAADPAGRFLYVGNSGSTNITAFAIDPITGVLAAISGSPFSAASTIKALTVSPSGRLLFAALGGTGVSAFTIDGTTGALTQVPPSLVQSGNSPNSVVVDPTGRFLYVANASFGQAAGTISAFSIGATGALTPLTGSPFPGGAQPVYLAIEPNGKFLYVANSAANNNVSAYAINATSGALTAVPGSPFNAANSPFSVVVDPSGQFVYVASQFTGQRGNIQGYSINSSTGALTPVSGSPFPTGFGPARMAVAAVGPQAISNPVPSSTQLAPSAARTGASTQVVSVFGSNFVPGSTVRWNGQSRATAFISNRQLNFGVSAADLATSGTAQVTVASPTPGGGTSASVPFTISSSATVPVFPSGGAVNAGGFQAGLGVVPGSIAAAFGTGLAASTTTASSLPLPTSLGGSSMLFNGTVSAPLFFTSAGQMNVQIPWEFTGQSRAWATVTNGSAVSTPSTVTLVPFAPGIFTINNAGTGQGAILIASSGEFAAPSGSIPGATARPVRIGEFLTIYCTGLGDVSNRPATGAASSGTTLSNTTTSPTATIGGVNAPVSFSGLAPGFVGLYQVNVQVPAGAPTGNSVTLVLTLGGLNANTVTVAVQ